MTEEDVPRPIEADDRIYIRDAAELLNRRMGTLRKWENQNILPPHLKSHRGHRGWRYWTAEQVEGIREWLRDTDRRPGKGLPHYNPTDEALDRALAAMRMPRPSNAKVRTAGGGEVDPDLIPKKRQRQKKTPEKPKPIRKNPRKQNA